MADTLQPPGRPGGGGGGDQSPRSVGSASGAATPTPLSSSSSSTSHHFPSIHNAPPSLPPPQPAHPVLKFHNTFPPDSPPAHHHHHHPHHPQNNNSSNHHPHIQHHQPPPPPPSHSYIRAPPHHPPTPPQPIHHSHLAPLPPPPIHIPTIQAPPVLQHPPPPPSAPLSLGSRQHDSPPPPQPPRPASSPAQSQKTSIINVDSVKNGLTTNKDTTVVVLDANSVSNDSVFGSPAIKRMRLMPPVNERLMLYVRQDQQDAFTPLHLVPPTTLGLLTQLEEKFKISMGSVKNLYRRNSKGILAKVDDDMLKHYCQEDCFTLEVKASENDDALDITLAEFLPDLQQQHEHASQQQPPPLVQVPQNGSS